MRTPKIDPVLATDRFKEGLRLLSFNTLRKLDLPNCKKQETILEALGQANTAYRELLREIGQLR